MASDPERQPTPSKRSQGEQKHAAGQPGTKPGDALAARDVAQPNNRAVRRGDVTTRSMGGRK